MAVQDRSEARLAQLSVKPRVPGEHGLPKHSVPTLRVGPEGAEGDHNNYRSRKLPRDRDQALLLVTQDLLATLGREGWPVAPGDLGENVTLAGVREADLAPGVELRIGPVSIMVTKPCDPCTALYVLPYVGDLRGPEFLETTMGRRGWYARVVTGGTLQVGDPVRLGSSVARFQAGPT
jgi:MOSC domain-containing protein YiiM